MPKQGTNLLFLQVAKNYFLASVYEILLSGAFFTVFYALNLLLTQSLTPEFGAHWVFIPAGIRLLLTLVFPVTGPIGIGISAFLIAYFFRIPGELISALGVGVVVAFSPYLSRKIVVKQLNIQPDLSNISITKILYCTFVFAIISALFHHSWFVIRELRSDHFQGFWVEFIGNMSGTFLVLSVFKICASFHFSKKRKAQE